MRQDQYALTLVLDGRDLGIWDKMTGGEIDSEEVTYKEGNMGGFVSLGGSVTPGNVTVQRRYDLARDHELTHWLIPRVGRAEGALKKQPLDVDKNAYGRPITYRVKLKQVNPPEVDSESTDVALQELEFTVQGTPV